MQEIFRPNIRYMKANLFQALLTDELQYILDNPNQSTSIINRVKTTLDCRILTPAFSQET
jgi:hypothetical protein